MNFEQRKVPLFFVVFAIVLNLFFLGLCYLMHERIRQHAGGFGTPIPVKRSLKEAILDPSVNASAQKTETTQQDAQ